MAKLVIIQRIFLPNLLLLLCPVISDSHPHIPAHFTAGPVCPLFCPHVYTPVCGTDNRSYDNVCRMQASSCLRGVEVGLQHVGKCGTPEPCPTFCPILEEEQYCGSDGRSYLSMCHVQAAVCRGIGPLFVREGSCQEEGEEEYVLNIRGANKEDESIGEYCLSLPKTS